MRMKYVVDAMRAGDWEQVRSIYLEGIATGHATFETDAPSWESWDAGHLKRPRLTARCSDDVTGWAALSSVSNRRVYEGVAEVSVYVGAKWRGRGIGLALLEALIDESERSGIWTLQAGIFPENTASVKMHLRCGFRRVGLRERIAKHNGVWRDTLLLERRSKVAGLS